MHEIEPYYNWRNLYVSSEDERSPFYGRDYSEFYYSDVIYDHVIHPQWDNIDSTTLFIKILFVEYDEKFAVIELFGEWNDTLYNDIRILKRNIIDALLEEGIIHFILIGENVLNFHSSDDSYYEEWFEDVEDGWIAMINFREHVMREFQQVNVDQYFLSGGAFEEFSWRTLQPSQLFLKVSDAVAKRLEI